MTALIPKRQFLVKSDQRAKVLNVTLDPCAYWQYTNSPFDNTRRDATIAAHGFEKGFELLAAEANQEE